jgi:hypothetical protein
MGSCSLSEKLVQAATLVIKTLSVRISTGTFIVLTHDYPQSFWAYSLDGPLSRYTTASSNILSKE